MPPKVIHLAAHLGPSKGILAQMKWEQEAADRLSLPWEVRLLAPDGVYGASRIVHPVRLGLLRSSAPCPPWSPLDWLSLRFRAAKELIRLQGSADLVLLRHSPHDPFQYFALIATKTPVVLVSHTIEARELELVAGGLNRLRTFIENLFGPKSFCRARGVVGVTEEILDHHLSSTCKNRRFSAVYPNGIVIEGPPADDRRKAVPELLFVASHFSPWHGLDLLLDLLDGDRTDLKVHLVGNLPPDLVDRVAQEPRLISHGPLDQEQIRFLAGSCWLGIGTLMLQRTSMKQACPLKVREYLALGIPVVATYSDVFPSDFGYFRTITPTIAELVRAARDFRFVPRASVRDASLPYIDKHLRLSDLYEDMCAYFQDR